MIVGLDEKISCQQFCFQGVWCIGTHNIDTLIPNFFDLDCAKETWFHQYLISRSPAKNYMVAGWVAADTKEIFRQ